MLDNKYTKWYNELIENRKNRNCSDDTYYEKHHIVPKTVGGGDEPSNLIYLTPKEHFVAHLLLTKMYSGEMKYKLMHAFSMMFVKSKKNIKRGNFNSNLYSSLRQDVAKRVGEANKGCTPWNKGLTRSEDVKNAISTANKGKTPWNKNRTCTASEREKMKLGWAKKIKNGFTPYNKGKSAKKFICDHCGKEIGGASNFKRWHGDNCKKKVSSNHA